MKRDRYYVWTWDPMKEKFTPQYGVRCGPHSLFGLRKALRKLKQMGYVGTRGDNSVLVEKRNGPSKVSKNTASAV